MKTKDQLKSFIEAGKAGDAIDPNIEILLAFTSMETTLRLMALYIRQSVTKERQRKLNVLIGHSLKVNDVHPGIWEAMRENVPGFDEARTGKTPSDFIREIQRLSGPVYSGQTVDDVEHFVIYPYSIAQKAKMGIVTPYYQDDVDRAVNEVNTLRKQNQSLKQEVNMLHKALRRFVVAEGIKNIAETTKTRKGTLEALQMIIGET